MSETGHPIPSDWLTAYYDGQLDVARQALVAAHVLTCAECQRELAALKALSEALSVDKLAGPEPADDAAFWQVLEPRLPDRRPAPAPGANAATLIRWLPGLSLLVFHAAVQVVALVGTGLIFILRSEAHLPAWTLGLDHLAAAATLGWLSWLWPAQWNGLGYFAVFITVSGGLAVLYLAWLAYEWCYGAARQRAGA